MATTTKKAPKAAGKKAPAVKATKANTAPKSKPMPNGESVHAHLPTREPVWNARRVAVVKALRKLRATSEPSARTAAEIASASGLKDDTKPAIWRVRIVLDVYRATELVHNGFVRTVREGRELKYYLTKAGQTTMFPAKPTKADK